MIHELTMGHFDLEALSNRRLVVVRPFDTSIVTRLLQEVGEVDEQGHAALGGQAVEIRDGYIVCPWLLARRILATDELARRLRQETGCVLYDKTRHEIAPLEKMVEW